MIDVNQLRKSVTFEMDNALWRVLEYAHHKPGRGSATIRTKARNLRTGATVERTFNSGDRVQEIRLDTRHAQFYIARVSSIISWMWRHSSSWC